MLKIKNLSVKIGRKKILDNISLNLKPGEVRVLMGPNGSGKTTLAQALIGSACYKIRNSKPGARRYLAKQGIGLYLAKHEIRNPRTTKSSGHSKSKIQNPKFKTGKTEVLLDGKSLLSMLPDERARAGLFVSFQNPVNVPGVKVFDFLRESRVASGGDSIAPLQNDSVMEFRELVLREAKRLGLTEKILDRDLDHFSGGERKRLEMLQALVLKPKYVIFDEVDSGVDIDGLKTIEKVVGRLRKEGVGILLITHQPRILKFIKPSKVHVLINGRIVKSGNKEILEKLEISGYKSFYCAVCQCKEVLCPKHKTS